MRSLRAIQLSIILLLANCAGCATNAALLAENADLKLKLHVEEEQLRQQQDYVAATQDRDGQIQSDFQQAYNEMLLVWDDPVEDLRAPISREEHNKCGI